MKSLLLTVSSLTLLLLVLSIATTASTVGVAADLTSDLAAKEAALDNIASSAEAAHQSRCSSLSGCAASCNVYACGNDFPTDRGFHCNSTFGTDTTMCGTTCNGLVRSMSTSVVRFPPGVSKTDPETQAFVCASKALDTKFREQLDTTKVLKAWSYVGHYTGSIRIYPGNPQSRGDDDQTCSTYDARLRPWFIAASSGPKDIVIIIDSSLSMLNLADPFKTNGQSRLDAVKSAVIALLGTLTQNDYVNVINFGTDTNVIGSTKTALMQASETNIKALQASVRNVLASGNTVMVPAFNKAFELLGGSSETTSGCTRIVLFLTDGSSTDAPTAAAANTLVLNAVNNSQNALPDGRKANVFTYSMSSSADDTLPKAIACANDGVWANINDGEDPLTEMRGYYQFLATGSSTTQVRWTTPYIDDFGLGQMVTAARPIYDYSKPVPLMVGVVGADITIAELEAGGSNFNTIVSALIARSKTCSALNLTQCDYQQLRSADSGYTCPSPAPTVDGCTSEKIVKAECTAVAGSSLDTYMCGSTISATTRTVSSGFKTTKETTCCSSCAGGNNNDDDDKESSSGLSGGAIAAIIVVAIILVVVGVIVGGCMMSRSKPAAQPQAAAQTAGSGNGGGGGGGRRPHNDGVPAEEMAASHGYNNHQNNNNNNNNSGGAPSYPSYPAYPQQNNNNGGYPAPPTNYPAPPAYPGAGENDTSV